MLLLYCYGVSPGMVPRGGLPICEMVDNMSCVIPIGMWRGSAACMNGVRVGEMAPMMAMRMAAAVASGGTYQCSAIVALAGRRRKGSGRTGR